MSRNGEIPYCCWHCRENVEDVQKRLTVNSDQIQFLEASSLFPHLKIPKFECKWTICSFCRPYVENILEGRMNPKSRDLYGHQKLWKQRKTRARTPAQGNKHRRNGTTNTEVSSNSPSSSQLSSQMTPMSDKSQPQSKKLDEPSCSNDKSSE